MQQIRTTLRIRSDLKKAVELMAFQEGRTFQDIFNQALEAQLKKESKKRIKKIKFVGHHLGVPSDNLSREDYYAED